MKDAPRQTRLILGGVYSTDDLVNNLGVSPNTIGQWVRQGLIPCSAGTKTQSFLADDIVDFWKRQKCWRRFESAARGGLKVQRGWGNKSPVAGRRAVGRGQVFLGRRAVVVF